MKTGTVHEPNATFLRLDVGEATDENTGITYELTLGVSASTPIVQSSLTQRSWTITWQELIVLAVQAGINDQLQE